MNNLKIINASALIILIGALFTFNACKKSKNDLANAPKVSNQIPLNSNANSVVSAITVSDGSTYTATVLGAQLQNPFALATMQTAFNNLTQSNCVLQPTHKYVRFLPANEQAYMDLLEDTTLDLFDTPFDYKILIQGNYYQEPGISLENITWQYCVVPVSKVLPSNIETEILSQLYLPSGDFVTLCGNTVSTINLEQEAFYLTGNEEEYETGDNDTGSNPGGRIQLLRQYHPQGYIRTENTRFGTVGVRHLQVKSRRWFNIDKTWTDANGYFYISNKYRGDVHINLEFKNQNCAIRAIRGIRIWQIADAVDAHVGMFHNSDMENVSHLLGNDLNNVSSEKKRIWMSAQTINCLEEYRDMALVSQIGLPDNHLNIWLTTLITLNNSGSSPMLRKMANSSPLSAIMALCLVQTGNPATAAIQLILQQYLPDVTYGYKTTNAHSLESDEIAYVLYHEFGHTSHFRQVGNSFWINYVSYIITHAGYGSPSSSGSQRVEVSEGWANYVGHVFTHIRYGALHSSLPSIVTWQFRIENFLAKPVSGNFPFDGGGAMYDMTENGEPISTSIRDEVHTYTMSEIYSALPVGITSVQGFHNLVLSQNGNKEKMAVDVLFADYGF